MYFFLSLLFACSNCVEWCSVVTCEGTVSMCLPIGNRLKKRASQEFPHGTETDNIDVFEHDACIKKRGGGGLTYGRTVPENSCQLQMNYTT